MLDFRFLVFSTILRWNLILRYSEIHPSQGKCQRCTKTLGTHSSPVKNVTWKSFWKEDQGSATLSGWRGGRGWRWPCWQRQLVQWYLIEPPSATPAPPLPNCFPDIKWKQSNSSRSPNVEVILFIFQLLVVASLTAMTDIGKCRRCQRWNNHQKLWLSLKLVDIIQIWYSCVKSCENKLQANNL